MVSLVTLFPLAWIVITSFKGQVDIFRAPMSIIPSDQSFWPISRRFCAELLGHYISEHSNCSVLSSRGAADRLRIGRLLFRFLTSRVKTCFVLVLTRLMISPDSVILPNYLTIMKLKLVDTLMAVGLPFVGSAQAILLLRQAFLQIPKELKESATVDGCGDLLFLWKIGIPLVKPAILTFSIISVVYQWNAFFWPMLVTESNSVRTLPVGLAQFGLRAESGSEWGLTMMATLLVVAPILIAFFSEAHQQLLALQFIWKGESTRN